MSRLESIATVAPRRAKVACINWNQPVGVPRAVSYVLVDGAAIATVYHATWNQAMRRATEIAERLERSRRGPERGKS